MGRRWRSGLRGALHPSWTDRNFDLVFLARLAMSVGRALAGVATPVYLALQGFSAFELSVYVLVVALASALLSAAIGLFADRIGRKPFLVTLPLLTAASGVTFAFTSLVPALFVFGALGSFGRGAGAGAGAVGPYQPAESAFVTDDLPARHRNTAFGRLAFGASLGATVGGLLALLAPEQHLHGGAAIAAFRPAFLAVAAVSATAGLLALGLVEPAGTAGSTPAGSALAGSEPTGVGAAGSALNGEGGKRQWLPQMPRRSRWLLHRLWITNAVNGMAVGMVGPFIAYWFFRRFGVGAASIGVMFAVINAATMVSTLSGAGLARRWGLVRTITVVRTAQAVLLVPMVLAPTFTLAGGVYLVRMMVQRVGMPLRQSYVLAMADQEERASVAALSNLPSQLAMAGGPLFTGYLIDEVSLSLPFEIGAALQFISATTFWGFFRHRPPGEETHPAHAREAPEEAPEEYAALDGQEALPILPRPGRMRS